MAALLCLEIEVLTTRMNDLLTTINLVEVAIALLREWAEFVLGYLD